jgi:predicted dehydrogenase
VTKKVKWGILGAASIARRRVVPAMRDCELAEVAAVGSRSLAKSQEFAKQLGIPRAYGSYQELIEDPEIEAIYNPLPNHLHVEWSIRAASRGKHVLCEKPVARTVAEARRLLEARDQYQVKIGEAFMVRTHPQWLRTQELIRSGKIGKLRSIAGYFSYFNIEPENVRNSTDFAGGALMDIGCYPVKLSRFIFGEEPRRVLACIERDPSFGTDRLTSAILEFSEGQSIFTCSTQLAYYQRMQFFGTAARLDVEVPFNAPTDNPCRLILDDGKNLYAGSSQEVELIPVCNQFTIQADLFSKAVRDEGKVPNPLEDAVANTSILEALFRSAKTERWERPERV